MRLPGINTSNKIFKRIKYDKADYPCIQDGETFGGYNIKKPYCSPIGKFFAYNDECVLEYSLDVNEDQKTIRLCTLSSNFIQALNTLCMRLDFSIGQGNVRDDKIISEIWSNRHIQCISNITELKSTLRTGAFTSNYNAVDMYSMYKRHVFVKIENNKGKFLIGNSSIFEDVCDKPDQDCYGAHIVRPTYLGGTKIEATIKVDNGKYFITDMRGYYEISTRTLEVADYNFIAGHFINLAREMNLHELATQVSFYNTLPIIEESQFDGCKIFNKQVNIACSHKQYVSPRCIIYIGNCDVDGLKHFPAVMTQRSMYTVAEDAVSSILLNVQ